MRTKDLNLMKVIDCLLKYNRLPLSTNKANPEEKSFYEIFGIKYDSARGAYIDSDIGISKKTLDRYIEELTEQGIFCKKQNYYYLNKDKLVKENNVNSLEWKKLLNSALDCGELETYCKIKNFLGCEVQNDYLGIEELQNYANCISDNVHRINFNRDMIDMIVEAISKECEIDIVYNRKRYTVFPLCILVSRDGKRSYLCAERKKRLEPLFDLSKMQEIKLGKIRHLDKSNYMDHIKKMWDTDIQKPEHVKILVRKGYEASVSVYKELEQYFGTASQENERCAYFAGEVYGINGFKSWIRENLECCIILEPVSVRNELISALQEKLKRYGELV